MKNIKIIAVIAITYIGLMCISTESFATSKGITQNDTTRLREKASTSSSTVTLISINKEVEILSTEGDWYKVKYISNGKTYTGYIRNDMLSVENKEENKKEEKKDQDKKEEPEVEPQQSTENEKNVDNYNTIEVTEGNKAKTNNDIDVRILPLIQSNKTGTIKKDKDVTMVEVIGNWCYVEADKKSGWVMVNELKGSLVSDAQNNQSKTDESNKEKTEDKENTESKKEDQEDKKQDNTEKKEEPKEESKIEQTAYVSSETVNVRQKEDSNSKILKQLPRNTKVTIIEKVDGTWSKVKVNGVTGYIASKYLSDKKVEVTSRGSNTPRDETEKEEKKEEPKVVDTDSKNNETKKEESNKKEEAPKTSTGKTGADIVSYAKKYLGSRYVSGGASPKTGFDCSGLTYYVYGQNGYSINRTSSSQASNGKKVAKSDLKQGDLVLFKGTSGSSIGHVGIYVGDNKFIHAANSKKGVITTSLSDSYYSKKYVTARRIVD